jgi:lipoprotein-anchoring transpeptidase ErfK/SrfK
VQRGRNFRRAALPSTIFHVIRRLVLCVLVIAALAPVLRGDAAPPVLIAQGVTLAGVPVGGMSNEQAQAALRPAFARPVRLVYGDTRWRLRPAQFGMRVVVREGVEQALLAQPGTAVPLIPKVDVLAVRKFVRALDKRISYPAVDAEFIGLRKFVPEFKQERAGVQLMFGATTERIVRGLRAAGQMRIRVAVRAIEPEKTVADFGPIVVIRRGANELRYYEGTKLVRKFGVATGQSVYPTPTGMFSIVDMQLNPWWIPPDSDWAKGLEPVPPGPGNPLGTRWMGLSAAGVGIHGTPDDASIGYSASHGCIRMHISDAEWVFHHVEVGTPVLITDS